MPNFSDIIGQDSIKEHLMRAISEEKISHAYILNGERYSGKEFIANVFAAALLCEGEEKPCGRCQNCIQSFSDNHP